MTIYNTTNDNYTSLLLFGVISFLSIIYTFISASRMHFMYMD